jgi:hypothetical protein
MGEQPVSVLLAINALIFSRLALVFVVNGLSIDCEFCVTGAPWPRH